MSEINDEHDKRVRLDEIDVEHAQREYGKALEAYRFGVKRIVAGAREEISKLRFDRDEARLRITRMRVHLDHSKAVRDAGFEK